MHQIEVTVLQGAHPPGHVLTFASRRVRLGRGGAFDVDLGAEAAPGCHAEVVAESGTLYLIDRGSPHGVFKNQRHVTAPEPVAPGDVVQLGSVAALRFTLRQPATSPPPGRRGDTGRSRTGRDAPRARLPWPGPRLSRSAGARLDVARGAPPAAAFASTLPIAPPGDASGSMPPTQPTGEAARYAPAPAPTVDPNARTLAPHARAVDPQARTLHAGPPRADAAPRLPAAAGADDLQAYWSATIPAEAFHANAPGLTYRPDDEVVPAAAARASLAVVGVRSLSGAPTVSGAADEAGSLSGARTVNGAADDARAAGPSASASGASAILSSSSGRGVVVGAAGDTTYTVVREIGRGGMGQILLARQESLSREVALKKILAGQANDASRAMFVSEALVMGSLEHPNIVPVHDLSLAPNGSVLLSMKLIRGVSWQDLLHPRTAEHAERARGYALDEHLGVFDAVCNAVAFAHSREVVHCDLKPENVMVGEYGEVQLMDWGIAVDVGSAPRPDGRTLHRSQIKRPRGTPSYMAPELAEGRGEAIDVRTDIYLLGAILHEVLTGRPPHQGGSLMAVLMAASESAPPELGPDIPADLQAICRRALARDPEERYPAVTDLQHALKDFFRHRESRRIAADAEAKLREAGALQQGDRSAATERGARGRRALEDVHARLYGLFAEAVAGFLHAQLLWEQSPDARAGEHRARLAYAYAALANGDLGLARAQARELPQEDPKAVALLERIEQQRVAERRAKRAVRLLKGGLAAAALAIVVGLSIGHVVITRARDEAQANERVATTERARAEAERREAEAQRQEAEAQRAEAEDQRRRADRQRQAAEEQRERAEEQQALAEARRLEALGVTYNLYRDKFELAREQGLEDEAALWLGAAIATGRERGLETGDDELALLVQLARMSSVRWRTRPAAPGGIERLVAARSGRHLWAHRATRKNPGLERIRTSDGGRTWAFQPVLGELGEPGDVAFWEAGDRFLATSAREKLFVIDPETARVERTWPEGDERADNAVCVPAGQDVAWVVRRPATIQAIDLRTFEVQRSIPLPYDRDARVWFLDVDPAAQRLVACGTLGGQRRVIAVDLATGAVLVDLPRESGYRPCLRAAFGRAVWAASDGEVVALDLRGESPSHWRKRTPWFNTQVVAIDERGFTIQNRDGCQRRWTWEGELLDRTSVTELHDPRVFDLPGGRWIVAPTGVEVRDGPGGALRLHYRPEPRAKEIARVDDARVVVWGDGAVELLAVADRARLRRLAVEADGVAVDPASGAVYTREGTELRRYEPDRDEPAAGTDGAGIAKDTPLLALPGDEGLVAVTDRGAYRFDARTLARRERLAPFAPRAAVAVDGGVILVRTNEELGRIEVHGYGWAQGRRLGPVAVPARIKSVTAVAFDPAGGELLWGLAAGEVYAARVLGLPSDPRPVPLLEVRAVAEGGAEVTALARSPDGALVVARADGSVERFQGDAGSGYARLESLDPFQGERVEQALAVGARAFLCRSAEGDYGLLALAGRERSAEHRSERASGEDAALDGGLYAYPEPGRVVVERAGAAPVRLTIRGMTSSQFGRVRVAPGRDVVVAANDEGRLVVWTLPEPGADGGDGAVLDVFPSIERLAFVAPHRVAVTYRGQLALVDVAPGRRPAVAASRRFQEIGAFGGVAATGGGLVAFEAGVARLLVIDPAGSAAPRAIAVPEPVTAVAGTPDGRHALVGALARAFVVDLGSGAVLRRIDLDPGAGPVRALAGVPGAPALVAAAGPALWVARFGERGGVLRLPVGDDVTALAVRDGRLQWVGGQRFGELELPDLRGAAPSLEAIGRMTGWQLSDGKLERAASGVRVRAPEAEEGAR